jgi:putative flippase GtrA
VELWRYGQAGAVNAAFGFGTYSLLVWLGLDIFVAQALATVLGTAFNYVTYSRHVFRDATASKLRFAASYGLNYLVSVVALAGASRLIASPYIAGFAAIVVTAAINYLVLRNLVFVRAREA